MDTNFALDNGVEIYFSNLENQIIVDEYTFNFLVNYFKEKLFLNYLLIIFLFSCITSFYACNFKNHRKGYTLVNQDSVTVKGEAIENV